MSVSPAGSAVALVWLASGMASIVVSPRNRASQLLCASGVSFVLLVLLWPLAARHRTGDAAALLPEAADLTTLLATVSLCALTLTYPSGRVRSDLHRRWLLILALLALTGPVARLLGSPTLTSNGVESTARGNTLAIPHLRYVGLVGDIVWDSSPGWLVISLLLLVPVWRRGDYVAHGELRALLAALAVLGALLSVVVVAGVAGADLSATWFRLCFLLALAAIPVILLLGMAARARGLAHQVEASRRRLVMAEDEARRSIERDLHDGVQQQLVAILSLTQLAVRQYQREQTNPEAATTETLARVSEQVRTAITDLRDVVSGIRPPVLADAGVAAAVESRMAPIAQVRLNLDAARSQRWPAELESVAYFVVCEAVGNALKHAPEATVSVEVRGDVHCLLVQVCDDGPGILTNWRVGRGLTGLSDRVASVDGIFDVTERRPHGTVVTAELRPKPCR